MEVSTEAQLVTAESQLDDEETQQITPEIMRTMTRRSTRQSQRTQDDTAEVSLESIQEGDTNFLDLVSSFVDGADAFSPTQTQPQASLYPESQRFTKTPATLGKKRDNAGNVIDSPVVSRNPFATLAKTPGAALGLSQIFANTQAASSPFANVISTDLRSDLPSPGILLERHAQHPISSSPLQPISAYKKAGVEPASRYIRSSESQQRRSSSREHNEDVGLSQRSNDSDWEDNGHLVREQKRKERDIRGRAQLKAVSSPVSPAKVTRQQSPPSSPPRVSEQIIPDDEDCDLDPTQTQYVDENPSGVLPVLVGDVVGYDTDPIMVPETSIRPVPIQLQPPPLTQPSPSLRHSKGNKLPQQPETVSNQPVRIVNSQKSRSSTQQPVIELPKISSLESIELVPASPEYDSEADEQMTGTSVSNNRRVLARKQNAIEKVGPADQQQTSEQRNAALATNDILPASQVPETSSIQNNQPTQEQNKFSSALEMQPPASSRDVNYSSQPVHVPEQRRKRKRMDDISQEDDAPPATQISSFDVLEGFLALDDDPEAAKVLATSPQRVSTRKRIKVGEGNGVEFASAVEDPISARTTRSKPTLQKAFELAEREGAEEARTEAEAENDNGGEDGVEKENENGSVDESGAGTVDGDRIEDGEAVLPEQSTPERRPAKPSRWDLGDSPKARFVIDSVRMRADLPPPQTLRQVAARRSRQRKSATQPEAPAAAAMIQELSSTVPSAVSVSTPQTTPSEATNEIVASNMVIAHFYDGKSKYYPAKYLEPSGGDKLLIQWPGYDAEQVPSHSVCSFDVRVGDEVKVEIDGFSKTHFVVESLQRDAKTIDAELITDIYGHTHVILRPKSGKASYPIGHTAQTPVAVGSLSIDMGQWRRTSKRSNVFMTKTEPLLELASAYSTPPPRTTDTPATPSSHRRNLIKKEFGQSLVRKAGIFSNMAFALSYVDEDIRQKYARLIVENGGIVLENGFQDLFDDKQGLKSVFSHYGFTASLSNSHAAKAKHMQALALGLPCLSGKWVETSLGSSKLQPWEDYLLPAGESLDLDRAVKSRILSLPDFEKFKLSDVLKQRKNHFEGSLVLFTKRKSDKEKPYLFLAQAMSAGQAEEVIDLKTVKTKIADTEEPGTIWLLVERGGAIAAEELVQSLTQKNNTKTRRSKDRESDSHLKALDIRVVDSETIKQTLIMGRLSMHNQ